MQLNVGGVVHQTTRLTVSQYAPHMLSAFLTNSDSDTTTYFLDRNGHTFWHVLDFLRSGHLPHDREKLLALRVEADFLCVIPMLHDIDARLRQMESDRAATDTARNSCVKMAGMLQLILNRGV